MLQYTGASMGPGICQARCHLAVTQVSHSVVCGRVLLLEGTTVHQSHVRTLPTHPNPNMAVEKKEPLVTDFRGLGWGLR
jgi:hypothetical protein